MTPRISIGLVEINELEGNEEAAIDHYLKAIAHGTHNP